MNISKTRDRSVGTPHDIVLAAPARVVTPRLEPAIVVAPGAALGRIAKSPLLERPGIYVGAWYREGAPVVYIGQSGWCTANRLADQKFRLPRAVDLMIAVTDAADRLTIADVRVLERRMYLQLLEAGYDVCGEVPPGAVVPRERYLFLRHALGEVCASLKLSQVLFHAVPDGRLLVGPVTQTGVVCDGTPIGPRFRLDTPRGPAELCESGTSFIVEAEAPIRFTGSPSLKAVGVLQQELVHAGVAMPIGGDWFRIGRAIRLPSASAAARFVTGSVAGSPGQWHGISPGGPKTPSRLIDAERRAFRRISIEEASEHPRFLVDVDATEGEVLHV